MTMRAIAAVLFFILVHPASASKGLFMSAASANESTVALEAYLQSARRSCSSPWNVSTSPFHISSIAIQSVAGEDGALYDAALQRMLPALSCVPQLFVGTTIPRAADVYCGQVVYNQTFQREAIAESAAAARAFVARFPDAPPFSWYISPEQFLNYFADGCPSSIWNRHVDHTALAAAWGSFLGSWTDALAAVKPGTPILWSPAAPEHSILRTRNAAASATYAAALTASLRTIAAAAPRLDEIVVQDSIGKASNASDPERIRYAVDCRDAGWHANITRSALAPLNISVGVNMEMFLRKGHRAPASAIVTMPADPRELRDREVCYEGQGLSLGPSWEARYWLEDMTRAWAA